MCIIPLRKIGIYGEWIGIRKQAFAAPSLLSSIPFISFCPFVGRALTVKPDASVYSSLGGLFFNTGRFEEARLAFKLGLELEPDRMEMLCSYVSC